MTVQISQYHLLTFPFPFLMFLFLCHKWTICIWGFIFGLSVLFHCPRCLLLLQHHSLWLNLKLRNTIQFLSSSLYPLRILLVVRQVLWSHTNISHVFFVSLMSTSGISIVIALNLHNVLGKMMFNLTMSTPLVNEHGISFHFVLSLLFWIMSLTLNNNL